MDPEWDMFLFSKGRKSDWLREFDLEKGFGRWYRWEDQEKVLYTDTEHDEIVGETSLLLNMGG